MVMGALVRSMVGSARVRVAALLVLALPRAVLAQDHTYFRKDGQVLFAIEPSANRIRLHPSAILDFPQINFLGGLGGTVTTPILFPAGSVTAPAVALSTQSNNGWYWTGNPYLAYGYGNDARVLYNLGTPAIIHQSTVHLAWSTDVTGVAPDAGLIRAAPGVVRVSDSGSGHGWIQQGAGDKRIVSTVTNATTTFVNIADLTVTVAAARNYAFDLALLAVNTVPADGFKFDFEGGTATMTAFRAHCTVHDQGALLGSAQTTTLAADFNLPTLTGNSIVRCVGGFVVNGAGTLIPRFAENSTTTGLAGAYSQSTLTVRDLP